MDASSALLSSLDDANDSDDALEGEALLDPLLGSPDAELPQAAAGAIRDVLGLEGTFIASPGTYDQKHVVRRGGLDACIAYGPGRLVLAHQPDEHIAIDDLVKATKVMAVLTLRLHS
jgi:succinyl-diaminopimelate desuccinylase